ncbi:hypothetical protein Sjap_002599 [Stephania japonica]|uniref:Uncharacterized protein n=1 Tax=Stephania japonica TaxID=461633 RepID=A0AAP0KNX7_9MAGN
MGSRSRTANDHFFSSSYGAISCAFDWSRIDVETCTNNRSRSTTPQLIVQPSKPATVHTSHPLGHKSSPVDHPASTFADARPRTHDNYISIVDLRKIIFTGALDFCVQLGSLAVRFSPYATMSPKRMSPNTSSSSRGTSSLLPSVEQSSKQCDADVKKQYQAPVLDREEPLNVRIPIRLSKKKENQGWDSCINALIRATYDRKVKVKYTTLLHAMLKEGAEYDRTYEELTHANPAIDKNDLFYQVVGVNKVMYMV